MSLDMVPEQEIRYSPISSVWEGSDADLIECMLRFYPSVPPEPILDATYNAGRFWRGSSRRIISMDIDPKYSPMIVADNRNVTCVTDSSFGVVVYDPPHVGPQGRDKSHKRFDVDFGATMKCGADESWTLSYLVSARKPPVCGFFAIDDGIRLAGNHRIWRSGYAAESASPPPGRHRCAGSTTLSGGPMPPTSRGSGRLSGQGTTSRWSRSASRTPAATKGPESGCPGFRTGWCCPERAAGSAGRGWNR